MLPSRLVFGFLMLHIAAGTLALATFWLPLVARKGGALHRRVGWVYCGAMATVALSALVVCAGRLTDGNPENDPSAIFLAYVAVLSAANAQLGLRALRTRGRTLASHSVLDIGLPLLQLLAGPALVAYAVHLHMVLFAVFGVGGAVSALGPLRFWLRPPQAKGEWFLMHMSGMGASCIATVTAFLVVNASKLGLGSASLVVWVGPAVVGSVALGRWTEHYRQKMAAGRAAPSRPATRVPAQHSAS